uniref:Apple domain-containing protein n=1 Tax=Parascaris univalens TaxID=6257 RepID=A0A915B5F9_PARUN
VSGRKRAAGVRSQMSLSPSTYSAEQDAESLVSEEINVGSVKACCGYETDVYTAEEYDSQPSESTGDELFSIDGHQSSSNTEHELSRWYVDACFVIKKDRFLTGASPFERRIVKTQTQCAQFCLSLDYCVSALYSSISTCDAFNTKSGDGQAQLLKLRGYIYLEPKPGKSSACLIGIVITFHICICIHIHKYKYIYIFIYLFVYLHGFYCQHILRWHCRHVRSDASIIIAVFCLQQALFFCYMFLPPPESYLFSKPILN